MKKIKSKKVNLLIQNAIICLFVIVLLYLLISLYFVNHFFFNTEINGVNVSLKSHKKVDKIINNYIKRYTLKIIERNGNAEDITGQEIEMQYNEKNAISKVYKSQSSVKWIVSIFGIQKYYVDDLYDFNKEKLNTKIENLNCLNKGIIEPRNVDFRYTDGSYKLIEEIYGDRIIKDTLFKSIRTYIAKGKVKLDLNEKNCYINPKFTLTSDKTKKTLDLLNKYVSTKINYHFGDDMEVIDGAIINKWLSVNDNLEVVINKNLALNYIKKLSNDYDTVGVPRNFKSSTGKIIEVTGGLYGWKINQGEETASLIENIKNGEIIEKEPIYTQKALSREDNEIGNSYVEINITRQYLWFYKEGKLTAQGPVVTGNPNNGNSTVVGTYMLNYKQKDVTLKGLGYEVQVSYWMPFFGNMGLHDARWRYAFGGEIYKRRGTHGCVNAPIFLAKTIFENIESGIPIIIYEE